MLLAPALTLILAFSASAAPTNSSSTHADDDDPLETSETRHFRRNRMLRKVLQHLYGLGQYGGPFGGAGGSLGLDILSGLAHSQKYHHPLPQQHQGHGHGLQHLGYPLAGQYGVSTVPGGLVPNYGLHGVSHLSQGGVASPAALSFWSDQYGLFSGYGLGGEPELGDFEGFFL